jgi:hypothetical protein
MKKLLSKFAMDIFPSVIATILGAYIVNHYINAKPAADAPAAALSSVDSKKGNPKGDSKPAERSTDLSSIPEPGVRAKGISGKAITEKSAAEKPVEKPADKPAETASIPVETRRHQPSTREKSVSRAVPATTPPPAVEPVVATPNSPSPAETSTTPERDANDLARAAIERLRNSGDAPRAQEAAHVPEVPHAVAAPAPIAPPPVTAQPVQPLPPPILVSTPPSETFGAGPGPGKPPANSRADEAQHRPTPPADIPGPPPLDIRADADSPHRQHTTVAEDVLSAAKSVFHAVLPNNSAK